MNFSYLKKETSTKHHHHNTVTHPRINIPVSQLFILTFPAQPRQLGYPGAIKSGCIWTAISTKTCWGPPSNLY